jgi:raffinose/stachyose/melibiose transport system permease protein
MFRRKIMRSIAIVCVYFLAVVYMFPVMIAIINSFKDKKNILISAISLPKTLYFENFKIIFTTERFIEVFFNSVLLTFSSILFIILISSTAGYALARWQSRMASVLMMLFLSSMFIPFHTIMITLLQTAKKVGATGNFGGLMIIYAALMCPISIFLYRGFIKAVPIELEEAAVLDRCNKFQLFTKIVFPLLMPITGTVAIINAMWIWNDFLLPYLVLAKPVTIPLSQMYFYGKYNQQWHLIMTGFVVSTLPMVIFFLAMQRFIIKGLVSGALKS